MKRFLLAGVAVAALAAMPLSAQPLPQPGAGRKAPTFEQMVRQQQQAQAEREAQDRAQHERDLARMTPEAREQYEQYGRERVQRAIAGHNLDKLGREMRRDVERNMDNLGQTVLGNDVFVNDPGRTMSNRQFGESAAHGTVQGTNQMIQLGRDVLGTARPLIEDLGAAGADIARERERLILQSNPNLSQRERDQLRYETRRTENAGRNIGRRLDEANYNMRETQRRVSESEQRVAEAMERMANEQGQDIQNWQLPQTPQTAPQTARQTVRPRPLPVPQQAEAPPPTTPPASSDPSPPPSSASSGTGRPVRRGEIPGQNGDPYEGLRVPASQGGTGRDPQQASNQQDRQARDAAARRAAEQAQAERNQQRTEQNRQAAQDRARRDNEAADSIFGAAERERQARAARGQQDMLDNLRRQSRPGNVGGIVDWGTGGPFDDEFGAGSGLTDVELPRLEYPAEPDAWQSFEMGGIVTVAELVPIYDGYDWWAAPPGSSGRSLSAAGTSFSSAGTSFSSAGSSLSAAGSITPSSAPTGMRVDWGGYNLSADPFRVANGGRPEPGSYAEMLAQLNGPRPSLLNTNPWTDTPWATSNRDLAAALYGPLWSDRPYQIQADPYGRHGAATSTVELANLSDSGPGINGDLDAYLRLLGSDFNWLRTFVAGDRGGLDRLLAQPFNVLLTWGANAYDLDLHMTGPLETADNRFHIYFAGQGRLDAQPFAQLIKDCICASGSEVILTSALNRTGGVYRVSVFNFGNQSASSTNLANQSQATLQIVRGGTAVSVGNGTTIEGGRTLLTVTAPPGQPGNTWVAAEIDPRNGRISAPGVIVQSGNSASVR